MSDTVRDIPTPHYLLLGNDGPVGPNVTLADSGAICGTVYGFSSKACYDRFRVSSEQSLRPYPLLKGHFDGLQDSSEHRISLVALDPAGPVEVTLQATTGESLLQALLNRTEHVPVEFSLAAAESGGVYQAHPVPP